MFVSCRMSCLVRCEHHVCHVVRCFHTSYGRSVRSVWSISTTVHYLDLTGSADSLDLCDLYDLYDLAHVSGWESYNNLHDLGHVSWVGSVLKAWRSCTAFQHGRLGSRWSIHRSSLSARRMGVLRHSHIICHDTSRMPWYVSRRVLTQHTTCLTPCHVLSTMWNAACTMSRHGLSVMPYPVIHVIWPLHMSYDVTRGQTTYYYTPYQGQNDKQNYDGEISGRILKITLKKTKYILLYSVPSLPGTEKKKWEGDIFFFVYSRIP